MAKNQFRIKNLHQVIVFFGGVIKKSILECLWAFSLWITMGMGVMKVVQYHKVVTNLKLNLNQTSILLDFNVELRRTSTYATFNGLYQILKVERGIETESHLQNNNYLD